MRESVARVSSVMAVAISMLVLLVVPGLAQEYPPGPETDTTPAASFGCDGVTAGGTASCSIGGWQAGSEVSVQVSADGVVVLNDVFTADDTGFIAFSFAVPAGTDAVAFSFAGTLRDGTPGTFTTTLEAGAAAGGGAGAGGEDLADTGEMISLLMLGAVLALAVGVVVLRRTRTGKAG